MGTNIKTITDLIFLEIRPEVPGILIVPGTYRLQIVAKALEVFQTGLISRIITTGGNQKKKEDLYEADFQKNYLVDHAVPSELILTETVSTNTKENAIFSFQIANKHGLNLEHVILVGKTYHTRRLYMTFKKVFKKSAISLVPAVDDRNITRNNWYKDPTKTAKVLEEVEKIGKYFLKGDLAL